MFLWVFCRLIGYLNLGTPWEEETFLGVGFDYGKFLGVNFCVYARKYPLTQLPRGNPDAIFFFIDAYAATFVGNIF